MLPITLEADIAEANPRTAPPITIALGSTPLKM